MPTRSSIMVMVEIAYRHSCQMYRASRPRRSAFMGHSTRRTKLVSKKRYERSDVNMTESLERRAALYQSRVTDFGYLPLFDRKPKVDPEQINRAMGPKR